MSVVLSPIGQRLCPAYVAAGDPSGVAGDRLAPKNIVDVSRAWSSVSASGNSTSRQSAPARRM